MSAKTEGFFPSSRKVYVSGNSHSDISVPFREITLTPTHIADGTVEENEPLRVYDTSGAVGATIHNPVMWNQASHPCGKTGFLHVATLKHTTAGRSSHRITATSPKGMNSMPVCAQNQRVD